MLQTQIGVLIYIATDIHKMGSRGFREAGILTCERGELETYSVLAAKLSLLDARQNEKVVH